MIRGVAGNSRQEPLVNFSRPGSTLLGDRRRAQESVTTPGSSALLTLYTTNIRLAQRLIAGEELTRDERVLADDSPYQLAVSTRGFIPATVKRLEATRDRAVETGKGDLGLALGIQGAIRQLNEESTTGLSPIEQICHRNQGVSKIILSS